MLAVSKHHLAGLAVQAVMAVLRSGMRKITPFFPFPPYSRALSFLRQKLEILPEKPRLFQEKFLLREPAALTENPVSLVPFIPGCQQSIYRITRL